MRDVEQTIISQYGNSATISQLIYRMNDWIRPDIDIDNFYRVVWDINTAEGFALDNWGRVVNLPTGRFIYTSPVTVLDDDQFRRLILIKALSNISKTSSPVFNQLLNNFFSGRGRAYVSDQGGMQMRYTFEFQPEPWEVQVMAQEGIFLRPAGVQVGILIITLPVFGFKEAGTITAAPWNQAPFVQAEIIT
jgi:hypothetical protein